MNEEDSSLEPKTPRQESLVSDEKSNHNPFEWPTDEIAPTVESNVAEQNARSAHLAHWATFWIVTWAGTTIAGGLFGGALGLFGLNADPAVLLYGLVSVSYTHLTLPTTPYV